MIRLGVWKFDDRQSEDKHVPHFWAYHCKTYNNGRIEAIAARCTVRGDLMQPGIHYDKSRTSAQSPSHTSRRLLYAKAALSGKYHVMFPMRFLDFRRSGRSNYNQVEL